MSGSQEQQSRTREFLTDVVRPAEALLVTANSRALKLYTLLNTVETGGWAILGARLGYFDPDWDPEKVLQEREPLFEMVLRDVGGERAFQDVMERFLPTPRRDVSVEPFLASVKLHARFQTMLVLETDLLRGAGSTLLSHLAFESQTSWDILLHSGRVEADEVAVALGGDAPNRTSQAYADYFTMLDHISAFGALDERDDPDWHRLHRAVGGLVGWRVNLRDPEVDSRFREMTREVTGIVLDECAKAGVGPRVVHGALSSRVEHLTARWKEFIAPP